MTKKPDIKIEELGTWDEYLKVSPDDASKQIYESANAISNKARKWYWTSIKSKKNASFILRILSFVLLIFGAALPILAGMIVDAQKSLYLTQAGVASLAVAGLIVAADRVFGWSSGWLRYIATVTEMETATHKFRFDWVDYTIKKTEPLNEKDKQTLFEIARKFVDEILKLQSDETNKWISEFNSSIALLSDLIQSQRQSAEKAQEAAKSILVEKQEADKEAEKSKLTGSVEVDLKHKNDPITLKICIDDEKPMEFTGKSWTKASIKPGHHTVRVLIDNPKQEIRKMVKILPNEIANIEMNLP
jgi:hypothetical protein